MHRGRKALKQSYSLTIGQNLARNMTDDVIRGCPTILNAKQELQGACKGLGNGLHIKNTVSIQSLGTEKSAALKERKIWQGSLGGGMGGESS